MRPVLVLLVLVCAAPVRADEIVLKSGGRLSCEILEATDTHVTVRLPHGTMEIPRGQIAEIVREDRSLYLRREAGKSLRAGATRTAVELCERALRASPDDDAARRALVGALLKHAESLTAQYRLAEAGKALGRLRELAPGHEGAARLAERIAAEQRVASALLVRARELTEARRYEEALQYLDAWRLRVPADDAQAAEALTGAHVAAGHAAAERGELRRSLDHFRAAAAYGGEARVRQELYLLRPIALLEKLREGDVDGARRLLAGIRTTYPDRSVPVFLDAVIHHVCGEVRDAVAGYAEAARIAERTRVPDKGCDYELVRKYATATLRAAIARPPEEGARKWREMFLAGLVREESRYFVVFAATAAQASAVADAADEAYARIARDLLGHIPIADQAELVIHPGRQAYLAADPDPPGSPLEGVTLDREQTRGVCYDTLDGKGRPLVRVETYADAPGMMEDTLPHELVHVVQRRGLQAFRHGTWFDEGLAMLYESKKGRDSRLATWRTLAPGAIPLPELLALSSVPPDRGELFYQQSHAFVTFLRGLGDHRDWAVFLDNFGSGDLQTAVRRAFGIESLTTLERRWREHEDIRPKVPAADGTKLK